MDQDNYIKMLTSILIKNDNRLSKENNKVSCEDLIKEDNIRLNNKIIELQLANMNLKDEIATLESKNNNLNIDINKLKEINEAYINDNIELTNENSELKNGMINLEKSYDYLDDKYDNLKVIKNNNQDENTNLKTFVIEQKAYINKLKKTKIKNNNFFQKKIHRKNDIIKNLIKELNNFEMINYDYPDLVDDEDNNSSYDLRSCDFS
jgi:predicted nuclease with TOPRIM domain